MNLKKATIGKLISEMDRKQLDSEFYDILFSNYILTIKGMTQIRPVTNRITIEFNIPYLNINLFSALVKVLEMKKIDSIKILNHMFKKFVSEVALTNKNFISSNYYLESKVRTKNFDKIIVFSIERKKKK
jgi:hypothetical protein